MVYTRGAGTIEMELTIMTAADPKEIVSTALAKGEMDKLLLGMPGYQYRSKYSPAPGNTDLTELLAVIYDRLDPRMRDAAKDALQRALYALSGSYEGIDPISTCILLEAVRGSDGRLNLGLPIEDLAEKLHATIRTFETRLRADTSGGGRDWPDGLLGDLRRLSRNTQKYGGPPFCD